MLHRSNARSQTVWTLIKDVAIYGILPFYCPQIVHKQLMIFFQMHFLFTFIQQTSLLLCHSGYLLLMLFSSDVFLFPEGTFRLKFSLNHYSYYLSVVMASTICKSSWWIAISPGSSRSSEWLQICIPWLFCPSHSRFQLAFLPTHSLLGAWAEKGSTQKGLGKKINELLGELSTHVDGRAWSRKSSVLPRI